MRSYVTTATPSFQKKKFRDDIRTVAGNKHVKFLSFLKLSVASNAMTSLSF